jgi:histone-binding protein RBBP4
MFGSAAEDNYVNVWDYEKVQNNVSKRTTPGIFFQHIGHRDKVVDFHWNNFDPWTIVSLYNDGESIGVSLFVYASLYYIPR